MSLTVQTARAAALTWEQVKAQLRMDSEDIRAQANDVYIPAAMEWFEAYANRATTNAAMTLTLDRLPGTSPIGGDSGGIVSGYDSGGYSQNYNAVDWVRSPYGMAIEIPRAPLKSGSVVVKYIDGDGVQRTWSSALYVVDVPAGALAMPARIWPASGQSWPAYRSQRNAIEIDFTAGYGDAPSNVPAGIRAAMLLHVEWQHDGRQEQALLDAAKAQARLYKVPHLLRANQEAS
jgi:uncharacterized phiE125 gp8 family phage protein